MAVRRVRLELGAGRVGLVGRGLGGRGRVGVGRGGRVDLCLGRGRGRRGAFGCLVGRGSRLGSAGVEVVVVVALVVVLVGLG